MLKVGPVLAVPVPMAGTEVESSLVKALANCPFKISTWIVGSD